MGANFLREFSRGVSGDLLGAICRWKFLWGNFLRDTCPGEIFLGQLSRGEFSRGIFVRLQFSEGFFSRGKFSRQPLFV